MDNGLQHTKRVRVTLSSFVCDAPARAFIKQSKGHAGYYGCDYCMQKGESRGRRMTFPSLTANERTDQMFRLHAQTDHHIGHSPLEQLPLNMITCFPPDYMHCVCLGFVRRFLKLLRSVPIGHQARLSPAAWNNLHNKMEKLRPSITVDFPRKCRGVLELDHWKASECRQFLLYIGPVVLQGLLPTAVYECFMCFSVCTYLACSPYYCNHYFD